MKLIGLTSGMLRSPQASDDERCDLEPVLDAQHHRRDVEAPAQAKVCEAAAIDVAPRLEVTAEVYAWAFGPLAPYAPPPEEQAISMALRQSFVNFAESKGRSPSGDIVDEWPMYELAMDPDLELGVPITTGAGYRAEQCDLWDDIFDRPSYQSTRGRHAGHCDDLDRDADHSTDLVVAPGKHRVAAR